MLKRLYRSKSKYLCRRCRSIDWAEICQLTNDRPYTHHRLFERRAEWIESNFACDLCQLIYDVDPTEGDLVALPAPSLFFSSRYIERERKDMGESKTSLGTVMVPSGVPVYALGIFQPNKTEQSYTPRLIAQTTVDYSMIRNWIDNCSNAHTTDKCIATKTENLPGL